MMSNSEQWKEFFLLLIKNRISIEHLFQMICELDPIFPDQFSFNIDLRMTELMNLGEMLFDDGFSLSHYSRIIAASRRESIVHLNSHFVFSADFLSFSKNEFTFAGAGFSQKSFAVNKFEISMNICGQKYILSKIENNNIELAFENAEKEFNNILNTGRKENLLKKFSVGDDVAFTVKSELKFGTIIEICCLFYLVRECDRGEEFLLHQSELRHAPEIQSYGA